MAGVEEFGFYKMATRTGLGWRKIISNFNFRKVPFGKNMKNTLQDSNLFKKKFTLDDEKY